jgi:hypothetical protein
MDAVDLRKFRELLSRADEVVALSSVFLGATGNKTIGLRHDVDDRGWPGALPMARWEASMGYRSTFYFLHTAPYWSPAISDGLREIAALGHEIGFHNNALAESRRGNGSHFDILEKALEELRFWSAAPVISTAAHGDGDCQFGGFVNYQIFTESRSAHLAANYKSVEELGIETRPLSEFGLVFQGDWLRRPHYLTDSGGDWTSYSTVPSLDEVLEGYPYDDGQLIVLQHPDWWPPSLYESAFTDA